MPAIRRRTAEHVGQHDDARAVIDPPDLLDDFASTLFHVVIRADAHRGDVALRSHHVLHGRDELVGESPVSDQYHADHKGSF
jgi:hypothetical protein